MNINLRRAHKLVARINDALKQHRSTVCLYDALNVWDVSDVDDVLSKKRADMKTNVETVEVLLQAKHDLRVAIDAANHASGISDIIAKRRLLLDMTEFHTPLVNHRPRQDTVTSIAGLQAQIERTKTAGSDIYSRTNTVEVMALDGHDLEQMRERKVAAERELEQLDEKLVALNISTEIRLNQWLIEALTNLNILS